MAFTPPAPGSIASRPTIKKGGVRGADESPEDFSQRMATRQASNATASPAAMPTRRDNILTARADGSFDAKRNAFNAGTAQHGRSMDEAGNITGSTAPAAAPRPASQLIPGRSAGSMVMPPAAPAAAAPMASPAPQAPGSPAAPAPAPPPGGIRPPAQAAAPMGPPSAASASAGKMSLTPQPAPAPASRMAQRQQRTQSPTAAPPPPSPAVPPQPGAPAAVPTPAARKPGMINDGQGWKPASEVNASLRAAQDARTAQAANPPPPPAPTPGPAQKALADFNAANPNVKSWAEQRQMQEQYQKNRDALTALQAKNKASPVTPPPSGKSPQGDKDQNIITLGKDGKLVETPASQTNKVIKLDAEGNLVENRHDASGKVLSTTRLPGTGRKSASAAKAPPPPTFKPTGQVHPSTVSGKPRFSPPPPAFVVAGARAKGGPIEKGKPYLVGEKGPEVVIPHSKPSIPEQALLGVVHTGGKIAKGAAGLVSMAANAKIKEADDYETGKTEHSSFVPIADRYKEDPWYKRIPKQISDGLAINPRAPEVQKYVKETSGRWASAGKNTLQKIKSAADNLHTEAGATNAAIEPQMGNAGKTTAFASSLIPGVRALDIPMGVGEAKSISGGIIPSLANAVTRKVPGGDLVKNAAQQAVGKMAESVLPARAKGGPIKAGKPYIVGEKGPEIVIPKQNGTVIPNHAIKPSLLVGR